MATGSRSGTALITGASGGIGLELARELAARGYDLALVARSADRLAAAAKALGQAHGVTCRVLALDLAVAGAAERVWDWLAAEGVAIDVLVNNAGFGLHGAFAESELGRELEMLQLNVVALTALSKLFVKGMVARRAGRILNVASTAAFVPGPFMAVYYASKAYVLSLSAALASELAGSGVSVTVLCPGPTRTAFDSTAGVSGFKLFKTGVMDANAVARIGVKGLLAGRRIVVPGLRNWFLASTSGLAPRSITARVARSLQDPADLRG